MTIIDPTTLAALSLEAIEMGAPPIPFPVPELPGADGNPQHLFLRPLSAADVLDFTAEFRPAEGEKPDPTRQQNAVHGLIVKAVVTPDGKRRMFENNPDALRRLPIAVYTRLAHAVTAMAGVAVDKHRTDEGKDSAANPVEGSRIN